MKENYCEANIRERHPDATERPCTRGSVRDVEVIGLGWYSFCEQHAQQVEAGRNVFDPERPKTQRD